MSNLTIRNITPALAGALELESRRHGGSLNEAVLALLERAVGAEPEPDYADATESQVQEWSNDDLREFESSMAALEALHGVRR